MQNYSVTYAAAITTFVPLLVIALGYFGVHVLTSDAVVAVSSIVSAIGFVWQIIHRHSEGDVTIAGFKKG